MVRNSILVIDDEPSVVDAVKLILEDFGYETVIALTGREGLMKAESRQFDVTITDLRLPDMSGFDVLVGLKRKSPRSAVIMITSYSTPDVVECALGGGAVDVLPKPFSPTDLLKLVNIALASRQS